MVAGSIGTGPPAAIHFPFKDAMMPSTTIRSVSALREHIAPGAQPRMIQFWGHRPARDGAVGKSCFSQWFEAPFQADGVRYPTAEHFMMAEKARLFADGEALSAVLGASTPAAAKAAGRTVRGFDNAAWLARRWDIVVAANWHKFSQHADLRQFLLQTGEHILVEASPVDTVWGSGLAADDPLAGDPQAWTGLNLLGFALMEVRQRLGQAQ